MLPKRVTGQNPATILEFPRTFFFLGVRFLDGRGIYVLDNHTTPARVREMNWNSDADIYRDCLGIDSAGSRPNHYELLGLRPYRVAPAQVTESSNQRLQQLESLRSNHSVYTRLATEIEAARDCLADPIRKRAYDRQIQRELFVFPSTSPATRVSVGLTSD